jgi:hypothetical protein
MKFLYYIKGSFIAIITSKDENSITIKLGSTILGSLFMKFKFNITLSIIMRRVKPLILFHVVIFTSIQLDFIISIIPSKSVDYTFVV